MSPKEQLGLHEKLIDAACSGDSERVKKLLTAGADPNYKNEQINTVLMWAVTHRHIKAVQELLKAGADINLPDLLGGTPLIVASANGDSIMVKLLLDSGADTSHKDELGNDALSYADHIKHSETVDLLRKVIK